MVHKCKKFENIRNVLIVLKTLHQLQPNLKLQFIPIPNVTHRNLLLGNILDIFMQNILYKHPIDIKNPTPLQLFPPIIKNLIESHFRDHFSNPRKLLWIYYCEKQVHRDAFFLTFFINFIQINISSVCRGPKTIFNRFMYIIITSASDNKKFCLFQLTQVKIDIIHPLTTIKKQLNFGNIVIRL